MRPTEDATPCQRFMLISGCSSGHAVSLVNNVTGRLDTTCYGAAGERFVATQHYMMTLLACSFPNLFPLSSLFRCYHIYLCPLDVNDVIWRPLPGYIASSDFGALPRYIEIESRSLVRLHLFPV